MPEPILTGRLLSAIRSVALAPAGLRLGAFPSVMPKLVEMGLVEERALRPNVKRTGWFLTAAGREEIRRLGVDEV
jgi:hypothetical protein